MAKRRAAPDESSDSPPDSRPDARESRAEEHPRPEVTGGKLARALELARRSAGALLGGVLPDELRSPDTMQFRHRGERASPEEIARIYADQPRKRDIVFFVHGLMYDEGCWASADFDMAKALEKDFGIFPVHLRYDTGKHISDNGLEFARLLEELYRGFEKFDGRWHLVAHSMGGLVSRSALHQARRTGLDFPECVDRVVLLATPNRGAPLEKGVQLSRLMLRFTPYPLVSTAAGLRLLFENVRVNDRAPLARVADITDFSIRTMPSFFTELAGGILEMRSDGVRDLRHGYMLREQWESPEAWGGMKPCRVPLPPLPSARYYAVAGSLSKNAPADPSYLVTDGMVSTASAANIGSDDELRFVENERFRLVAGVHHFVIPSSPEVYRVLAEWFARG